MSVAVFLDRDGVMIEEVHFLRSVEQVRLLPSVGPAIAQLNQLGLRVIVVTNQSGVARGLFPEETVKAVHAHLAALLTKWSAHVDAFYYCPHHPTEGVGLYRVDCSCRKPLPGMLLRAAREWDIDLSASYLIGDKVSDVQAGASADCRCVLVQTGYGGSITDAELLSVRDHFLGRADTLLQAVDLCLTAPPRHEK
jgi:D-glycero-D-manno-heptose 1,7-bisphosphate phosphatase